MLVNETKDANDSITYHWYFNYFFLIKQAVFWFPSIYFTVSSINSLILCLYSRSALLVISITSFESIPKNSAIDSAEKLLSSNSLILGKQLLLLSELKHLTSAQNLLFLIIPVFLCNPLFSLEDFPHFL